MEDKFVTLAIRTLKRAEKIKNVLEENGIETVIQNVNLEHPELSVGVRIRIKESDLPKALKIVEEVEKAWDEEKGEEEKGLQILVPLDFSDLIPQTIDFAFYFAQKLKAKIVFLNVYYSPPFTISSVTDDMNTYTFGDAELLRRIISSAHEEMAKMNNQINERISKGELPNVDFRFELKEGIPEDQILDYCKKNRPVLVIMGTRGKKISSELIGSVTAEVIEACVSPVLAIPACVSLNSPAEIKRIAFLTNFDEKDLIAIDTTISLFGSENLEIYFIHVSQKKEVWDEVMIGGIKEYFSKHYPELKTHYDLISSGDSLKLIDDYLAKNEIHLLVFNSPRRNLIRRLFNPGLAYKMVLHTDTPLFVTHV